MKLTTIILTFFVANCFGQSVKWTFNSNMKYEYSINSTGNKNLFDATEIKQRKIKAVYLIETWGDRDENGNATHQDTFMVYHFDESGRPVEEIHFETDAIGDSVFKRQNVIELNKKMQTNDSTVTQIKLSNNGDSAVIDFGIWKFEYGFDTAYAYKTVYDKNKNIIEEERTSTKAYFTSVDCVVGAYRLSKYRYDDQNRLVYIEGFRHKSDTYGLNTKWESQEYIKISYPFYGKLIETYNSLTNELTDREAVLINDVDGVVSTTDRGRQVSTIPLNSNSKLIGYVTIVNMSEGATIQNFEFRYK